MECIAIGCDISKGRCDVAIINQSGTQLAGSGGYDDIRRDHERLRTVLMGLRERYPESRIVVGMESTGGLERNWLAFFRSEKRWEKFVLVHRLNPLAVKRHLESDLHRNVNDASAARGIAQLVLEKYRERTPKPEAYDGRVAFYRVLRAQIGRRVEATQRLKALLPIVHPGLVQYSRHGLPEWVILVIERYPTAAKLARAKADALAGLSHVGMQRARSLITEAKESVASLNDPGSEYAISALIADIRMLDTTIEQGQKSLEKLMVGDPRVGWLESIPGIGTWSAIALALEIGDVSRFDNARSLIAWAGLDPHESVSGDGVIKHGISHRGNAQLRAILYMDALSAKTHNPVIAAFYQRLTSGSTPKNGKVAIVACAAKLLRIVYALLCRCCKFDADYEKNRAATAALTRQAERSESPVDVPVSKTMPEAITNAQVDAPITAKEARRRKKIAVNNAAAPCPKECEDKPQAGSGAAAQALYPPAPDAKRPMRRPERQQAGTMLHPGA